MVKLASGAVIAPPSALDGERVARRVLVYRTIVDAIRCGALPIGARLPSSRQLAAEWGYTPATAATSPGLDARRRPRRCCGR